MFSKSLVVIFISLVSLTQINAQSSNYLNQNWLLADITYTNADKLTDMPTRYDVKKKILEIKKGEEIITIPATEVQNLVFTELDLFLSFSYTEKQLRSVSHAQEMASLIGEKKKGIIPTPNDHYLDKSWKVANITFDGDKNLFNALAKYNLKAKALEIKQMNKTLSLPTTRIKELTFTQKDETFVSLKNYDNTATQFFGLLNIVYSNDVISLAAYHTVKETSPAGGDIGYGSIESRGKSYKKIEELCMIDSANKLFKVDRKTKKNSAFFGEHWEEVVTFVKAEKLSFKTKEDIIKIIDFYSSLVNA